MGNGINRGDYRAFEATLYHSEQVESAQVTSSKRLANGIKLVNSSKLADSLRHWPLNPMQERWAR